MFTRLFDFASLALGGLSPERAHEITLRALRHGLIPGNKIPDDRRLHQTLWDLPFLNPVGMAAGFDKNAVVVDSLIRLGFGFVEIGTLTPRPQAGNPKPRVFRLPADKGVINRLGFNNDGHQAAYERLSLRRPHGILGVNIGPNKESPNPIEDYVEGLRALVDVGDYFTINISSPNTSGLRDLQTPEKLTVLMSWITAARTGLLEDGKRWKPLLVKLSPDISDQELPAIIDCLIENHVDGMIISNTTLARTGVSDLSLAREAGGLSGQPLFWRSTRMLAKVFKLTQGKIPLIGVGGITTAEEGLQKIEAGASLIQLYTGLIYEGPTLIYGIKERLVAHIEEKGYKTIKQAIGQKAELWASLDLNDVNLEN